MELVIAIVSCVVLCVISFVLGGKFAINRKAKKMIEQMHMGTIVFDLASNDDTIQCQFDKNPREMLGLEFVMMNVKIRQ